MTDAVESSSDAMRRRTAFCLFAGFWAVLTARLLWWSPSTPVVLDLYVAIIAIIAAGAAGWCARVFGCRDYGWLAGIFVGPIFGILLTAPPFALLLLVAPAAFLASVTSGVDLGVTLIPHALAGTAVFLGLLGVMRRARMWRRS